MVDTAGTHADNTPSAAGMPRWVKGFVIAALLVISAVVVVQTRDGAGHGPSRHQPDTVLTEVPSTVHTSPVDHE